MTASSGREFLGVGWAFPLALDPSGGLRMAEYEDDVRQSIGIILGTARGGERLMRPDFASGLHALTFEPLNTTTLALLEHRVQEALVQWEPRIDQVTVNVIATAADRRDGKVLLDIGYRIRSSNTFYNLVYPFYLTEARER